MNTTVLNDPVNFVDPRGKWPEWIDDGVCYITGRCDPTDPDSPDWEDTLGDVIKDIWDKKDDDKPNSCMSF